MHSNRVRNIEIPENLFSNLGEINKNRKINNNNESIKDNKDNGIRLTNFSKHKEYRERINKMYDNFPNLIPIDSEIDNILYFNNYIEKGIVVKPKVSSLKQFWTEYRLITNEKKLPRYHLGKDKDNKKEEKEIDKIVKLEPIRVDNTDINKPKNKDKNKNSHKEKNIGEKLNSFDELFEALSQRVNEINSYIDELKEMRINIDESQNKLENERKQFKEEKDKFMDFKQEEEEKINKEKENLKVNYERLQNIIDDLDKKLNEIEK